MLTELCHPQGADAIYFILFYYSQRTTLKDKDINQNVVGTTDTDIKDQ